MLCYAINLEARKWVVSKWVVSGNLMFALRIKNLRYITCAIEHVFSCEGQISHFH